MRLNQFASIKDLEMS